MNKTIISVLALGILLSGCSNTISMKNYPEQKIAQHGMGKNTVESVELAIIRAAVSLGWKAETLESGQILATLDIRKHQLVVLITYDDKNYSIEYKDSTNLKYDGKKIHRQYANWVANLIKNINAQNIMG